MNAFVNRLCIHELSHTNSYEIIDIKCLKEELVNKTVSAKVDINEQIGPQPSRKINQNLNINNEEIDIQNIVGNSIRNLIHDELITYCLDSKIFDPQ